LQNALNIGRNRKPPYELIPESLDSKVKARLERADIILRLRLVDALLDQGPVETVPESGRVSFKLLQHVADLTGVITVRLRLGLYVQSDNYGKQ
jgi:hypothetical protein